MTTQPMSAEDFAILIVCNSGSKYLQKNTVVPITKMIEQRDQAFTAPLMERIKVLEKLVYVPGMWKCAKCSLVVTSNYLHAETGNVSANNDPQKCLNGCGPMWRVTERDSGNEMSERCWEEAKSSNNLRERIRVLEEALKFYASKRNYIKRALTAADGTGRSIGFHCDIIQDEGATARKALQTTAEGEV